MKSNIDYDYEDDLVVSCWECIHNERGFCLIHNKTVDPNKDYCDSFEETGWEGEL